MDVQIKGSSLHYYSYQIMNTFDYEMYLKSQNIKAVISVTKLDILNNHFIIQKIPYIIANYIDKNYPKESAAFLKLFILGIKNNDTFISNDLNQIGISHLFAISGLHLGLVIGLIKSFLNKLYISEKLNQKIILTFIIIYNIITGFKITILRASLLVLGFYLIKTYKILLTRTDLLSFHL